ncbi:hypothetical protein ABT340_09730 [Streptosporangium sp. NPDC000239]|uniref:hypothetical protein n=1 Tax=Streptosporangium sp. NPDC000239 TaxID=3154248 RepID=UPI003318D6A2
MSTSPAPLKLSAGASTGSKIIMSVLALPFVALPLFVILMVRDQHTSTDYPYYPPDHSPFRIEYLVLLIFALVGTVFLGGLVAAFRFRATLTGSVLEVRRTFRTRRADLATARVWLGSTPEYEGSGEHRHQTGRTIPHLTARDYTGPKVRLHLRTVNGFLPPHELVALADAVESGHREGPDAEQASRTAEVLRRLGTDPMIGLL